jgi:uncharacterized protein YndB with AHSA1/START domain
MTSAQFASFDYLPVATSQITPFMETKSQVIEVEAAIYASINEVWKRWTDPRYITQWNFASPEWHCPSAENDLRVGGRFNYRMEDKAGKMGFDFSGIYTNVLQHRIIEYRLDDDRFVKIEFLPGADNTMIIQSFEAETENSLELQRKGWRLILNSFKNFVEADH